jgi:hypothetical protein
VNRITIECDGLTAFLSPGPRKADVSYRSSEDGTVTFTGTSSYAETVALLRAGWPAGAEQARALSAQLGAEMADSMTAERPAPVWDVSGDDADVSRFLEGEPENMVAWVPEMVPAAGRVVRVVLDAGVNCSVKEHHLQAAGVMTAAAVDVLESRGVRCEVWVAYPASFDSCTVEVRHRLKAAEEALDLPRVVAGMHPSGWRRIAFRWFETRPECPGNYGHRADASKADGDLVFPAGDIGKMPEADRAAWLAKQAEAVLGIPA